MTARPPERVPAASLVLDYNLYPRHQLMPVNVRTLSEAIDAGEELPAVIVDRPSKRVVDGFHRVTVAVRRGADITVEWHTYKDDAAMFVDAVARNARHGMPLEPFDRARCLEIADGYGIDIGQLASALAVNVDVLGELRATRTAYTPKGQAMTIKRSLRHMAGTRLTERQVEANRRSSGWPVSFHADQIVEAIDADLVPNDQRTRDAITRLRAALKTFKFT